MSQNKLQARLNIVKFRNYLNRLDDASREGAREALFDALDDLNKKILDRVPRDTETLANSYSFKVIDEGNQIRARFGFAIEKDPVNPKTGLHASEYVLAVHEDLDARHPNGGTAKFLEGPVNEFHDEFYSRATITIMKKLRGAKI